MGSSIVWVDPARATVVRTFATPIERIRSLTTNRDGSYIVCTEAGKGRANALRVADGQVVSTVDLPNAPYPGQLAWSPAGNQVALLVVTGDQGYGGELRVFPVGLPVLPLDAASSSPKAKEAPKSTINAELVRQLASAAPPFTADGWRALLDAHARWLDSGGGGGDGDLPDSSFYESPWETLEAAGFILALWTGPGGTEGTQAVLRMKNLEGGIDLTAARLAWADLSGVYGTHLDLSRADLRGVTATDAHLPDAVFRDADLRMSDFSRANLAHADFTNANLEGCDFDRADLTGANFTSARIGGIKLANARTENIRGFGG
jgi:hypothetical protein